jgi:aspartate aminotransferase-like enzyme
MSCARNRAATVAAPLLQTLCKNPRWKSDSLTVVEVPAGIDSNKVRGNQSCTRSSFATAGPAYVLCKSGRT